MSLSTLAIDVGGSGIKALIFDHSGNAISERIVIKTPHPATPRTIISVLINLCEQIGSYDRIAIGFPSVVEQGITRGAINLHPDWDGFNLADALHSQIHKPIKIANDADVQGCGAIAGRGVELVITLGTGFGSAIFLNGHLLPNLELGQHPWRDLSTYEDLLGQPALQQVGINIWQERLIEAIASLYKLFNYDKLYIGGGNARLLDLSVSLPKHLQQRVEIVSNDLGLFGGLALWDKMP